MSQNDVTPTATPAAAKGKGKGKLVALLVTVLLLAGGSAAAGVAFGPKLLKPRAAKHPPSAASADAEGEGEGAPKASHTLDPIVVDIRVGDEELHHIKVGLALELGGEPKEEELKGLVPRGRDAAIGYLRSLTLVEVTDPAKFEGIRTELSHRIVKAMGKKVVKRVLFTDFVVQ